MAELVLLDDKRTKLTEGQDRLVSQLEVLLRQARCGEIRSLIYSSVGGGDNTITFGVLNADDCGVHELIGLSQMLNDRLLAAARE